MTIYSADWETEQIGLKGTRTNNIFPLTVIAHTTQLSGINNIIYAKEKL